MVWSNESLNKISCDAVELSAVRKQTENRKLIDISKFTREKLSPEVSEENRIRMKSYGKGISLTSNLSTC